MLIDEEEWQNGREFMERIKERWDTKHPEHAAASMQMLRDNKSRFKKR